MPDAAVILAGGGGRRLGGVDKPALIVGGTSLLDRALAAVIGVDPGRVVVVGPHRDAAPGPLAVSEDPPGSGPAAALAAGAVRLDPLPAAAVIAVLAADLPAVTAGTLARLEAALADGTGAVLVDAAGRRQYLVGTFRAGPLLAAATGQDWVGQRLSRMLDPLVTAEVPAVGSEGADIDTPDELAHWQRDDP